MTNQMTPDMRELQLISCNLFVTVRYRHLAPCNRKRIAANDLQL